MIEYSDVYQILSIEDQLFDIGFEGLAINLESEWKVISACGVGYNLKIIEESDQSEDEDDETPDEEQSEDVDNEEPDNLQIEEHLDFSNGLITFIKFLNCCSK